MIIGIIGTVLLVLGIIAVIGFIVLIAVADSTGTGASSRTVRAGSRPGRARSPG